MKKTARIWLGFCVSCLSAHAVFAQPVPVTAVATAFAVLPWALGPDGRVSVCDSQKAELMRDRSKRERCVRIGMERTGVASVDASDPVKMEVQEALEVYLKGVLPANTKPVLVGVGPVMRTYARQLEYSDTSFIAYYRLNRSAP